MRIAIIAGEASGDILGSRLISALKKYYPDAHFEGVGGNEMLAQGFESFYQMDRLSIMGYAEALSRIFELVKMRKTLIQKWLKNPPDVFIGIDAPDFNLKIEAKLHKAGVKTVHYVSPSVWAWREGRVKKMVGTIDLMLTLFPFEVDFYKKHKIPAQFVGHPLADEIDLENDQKSPRESLGLPLNDYILAVLPGSRMGEIKRIAPDFLKGLKVLHKNHPDWFITAPMISKEVENTFMVLKKEIAPEVPITLIQGQSRTLMAASDQVLMASGTAVLEGMLVGRPMVAAYRVAPTTAKIIRLFDMIKSKYFTLPNNLADEYLVPELIQEDITQENIVKEVEGQYQAIQKQKQEKSTDNKIDHMMKRFTEIHKTLRQDASESAARAVYQLIENKK